MTKDFNKLINDLQANTSVIAEFLSSPEKVLNKYDISAQEKEALLARDLDSLDNLGLTVDKAAGALSGAHSQLCKKIDL
ncbi:MAG: hypothetical protein Q3960_02625 [Lactobacillus sp.]|nr:hypothetical protein [Lactobacillus sp.]